LKVIKKYTAIKVGRKQVNNTIEVSLSYGDIEGPYYSETHPKEEFDTEEEAIEYAYEFDKYCVWMVVPVISFDLF